MQLKDFATKQTRVDGVMEPVSSTVKAIPIGRWVVFFLAVVLMVGYGLWNHHKKNIPLKKKPDSTLSPQASVKETPGVKFDFYHVLASDSGQNDKASTDVLVKSTTVPLPSQNSAQPASVDSKSSAPVAPEAASSKTDSTVSNETKPSEAKPAPVAPVKSVSKVKKIQKYEVVVGEFSQKDQAQSLRAKLILMGFDPQVSLIKGKYRVHFASTAISREAQTLKQQLGKSGISASIRTDKEVAREGSH